MTIEIIETSTQTVPLTGETTRHVEIIITSGGNSYLWRVGGLPAGGDLQAILEAREAELLAVAQARNQPVPEDTKAKSGGRQWFKDNPNALQIFTLSIADLQTEVYSLVDAIIPSATGANRTRLKLLLMGLVVAVRVLVKRELS